MYGLLACCIHVQPPGGLKSLLCCSLVVWNGAYPIAIACGLPVIYMADYWWAALPTEWITFWWAAWPTCTAAWIAYWWSVCPNIDGLHCLLGYCQWVLDCNAFWAAMSTWLYWQLVGCMGYLLVGLVAYWQHEWHISVASVILAGCIAYCNNNAYPTNRCVAWPTGVSCGWPKWHGVCVWLDSTHTFTWNRNNIADSICG